MNHKEIEILIFLKKQGILTQKISSIKRCKLLMILFFRKNLKLKLKICRRMYQLLSQQYLQHHVKLLRIVLEKLLTKIFTDLNKNGINKELKGYFYTAIGNKSQFLNCLKKWNKFIILGDSSTTLEELNKKRVESISSSQFDEYYKKIMFCLERDMNSFFNFYNLQYNKGLVVFNKKNQVGYSFCANLPSMDGVLMYLELTNTYDDVFTLCHELGHMYYFCYKNKIDFGKQEDYLAEEAFAYYYEMVLVKKIGDDFLKNQHKHKSISDSIYRSIYLKSIEGFLQRMNSSVTFAKIFKDAAKEIVGAEIELTIFEGEMNVFFNDELLYFSDDFWKYEFAQLIAMRWLKEDYPLYDIKGKLMKSNTLEDLLSATGAKQSEVQDCLEILDWYYRE